MTRKEFIKLCGLLGISTSLMPTLGSCKEKNRSPLTDFSGSVLIIGAGAAGLTSAYFLNQRGIKYTILEASSIYGGRMKTNKTFADFPLPLGAEWLHTEKHKLSKMLNKPSADIATRFKGYKEEDRVGYYANGKLQYMSLSDALDDEVEDQKFISATWLTFFEEHILPHVKSQIRYQTTVVSIRYDSDKVIVTDSQRNRYEADKVIVSVPIKMLKENTIAFHPKLPQAKVEALEEAPVWGGLKLFISFTEKFYPTFLRFPDSDTETGQRLYYDASYGQDTSSNILGLFAVGKQAEQYQGLSEEALQAFVLNELDTVFSGRASKTYIKHVVQNWSKEPFIEAAYLADDAPSYISTVLASPLDQKVYFAGDAYVAGDDWSGVHTAIQSAKHAVANI